MARRSKKADGFMVVMGIIAAIIYFVIKAIEHAVLWIKANGILVIGLVLLCLLVYAISEYIKTKKAEEVRESLLLEEEESRRIVQIESEKKMELINSFKQSSDYKLIEGYVTRYGYNSNTKYNSDFQKLAEVIGYTSNIDKELVLELIERENEYQSRESFKLEIKKHQPTLYNDYLVAAIESYGDDLGSYLDKLHDLLIEERVIHQDTQVSNTLSDLSNVRHLRLKDGLKRQLVDGGGVDIFTIDQMHPFQFERYIAELYEKRGYVAETTKLTGDQGADILVQKFGERTVIQVKLYSQTVGNKAVQEVCGAIRHYNAHKGVVITNSYFSRSAQELAVSNSITLIDRDQLKAML